PTTGILFYIYFFLDETIRSIINTLESLYEQTGITVGVDDSYFKPSLWRLYENQYLGYFARKALVNSRTIINLNWQNILLIKQYIEFMSKVNKLTTSFIKIANALDKGRNQDEYNIYVSMLDEEELECLKYVQRLRKYTHKQLAVVIDDDATKLQPKKRGRKNNNANDNGTSNEEALEIDSSGIRGSSVDSTLPPSLA
ncbi:MAG: hypothetical protein ACKPKO_24845, partial [Candidatus Fonsibacter sp.]